MKKLIAVVVVIIANPALAVIMYEGQVGNPGSTVDYQSTVSDLEFSLINFDDCPGTAALESYYAPQGAIFQDAQLRNRYLSPPQGIQWGYSGDEILDIIFTTPILALSIPLYSHEREGEVTIYTNTGVEIFNITGTGEGNNVWQFFGFVANEGQVINEIEIDCLYREMYMTDNIEFVPVPEPTTLSMIFLGSLLLRKRKAKPTNIHEV